MLIQFCQTDICYLRSWPEISFMHDFTFWTLINDFMKVLRNLLFIMLSTFSIFLKKNGHKWNRGTVSETSTLLSGLWCGMSDLHIWGLGSGHRFRDTRPLLLPRLWAKWSGVKPILAKKLLQLGDFAMQQHWFSHVISMEILTGYNLTLTTSTAIWLHKT